MNFCGHPDLLGDLFENVRVFIDTKFISNLDADSNKGNGLNKQILKITF